VWQNTKHWHVIVPKLIRSFGGKLDTAFNIMSTLYSISSYKQYKILIVLQPKRVQSKAKYTILCKALVC
jgi:hypothetical protein